MATFGQLRDNYKDAPKSIESLGDECVAIGNVLHSLEDFVKNINRDVEQDEDLLKQVSEVIKGTDDGMSQLQRRMNRIVKPGEQGTWRKIVRFMWNDREIQATHKRLHARKQSLELILTCWTRFVNTLEGHIWLLTLPSADSARMRNELSEVRAMLEESFTRSHQQALLNGSIGEAGSSSETFVGSSKSPKPGESVTEYDKPGELTIYSTPAVLHLKSPKLSLPCRPY